MDLRYLKVPEYLKLLSVGGTLPLFDGITTWAPLQETQHLGRREKERGRSSTFPNV